MATSKRGDHKTAPRASQLVYRVDSLGRGYWLDATSGKRVPKPSWDAVPRHDSLGRPMDATGRHVPKSALASIETPKRKVSRKKPAKKKPAKKKPLKKPTKKPAKEPPKFPRKKAKKKRVKSVYLPRPKTKLIAPGKAIPGFEKDRPLYWTRGAITAPKGINNIFASWLKGVARRTPMSSIYEIQFGQYGVHFTIESPIDKTDMNNLAKALKGFPVELAFQKLTDKWDLYVKMNVKDFRTKNYALKGATDVLKTLAGKRMQQAANIIYNYMWEEYQEELMWDMFIETIDSVYEG